MLTTMLKVASDDDDIDKDKDDNKYNYEDDNGESNTTIISTPITLCT